MKEKFLQFFTGQMSKSIYISVAAAVVCGAVVITSTVIVHNNNQKIDAVLESLSASESVTETVTESATESVSASGNEEPQEPQPQAQAANNEPAGDKALQYLAEYDKLTKEYEAKRAELEKQVYEVPRKKAIQTIPSKPTRVTVRADAENADALQEQYDKEYESKLAEWEKASQADAESAEKLEREYMSEQAKVETAQKQIDALDAQYEKDVSALKARYGI